MEDLVLYKKIKDPVQGITESDHLFSVILIYSSILEENFEFGISIKYIQSNPS
jgi:hypothetical protein